MKMSHWMVLVTSTVLLGASKATQTDPRLGQALFERVWQPYDARTGGDGLGPMYNATSCVACHNQGGVGGAGGNHANVSLGAEERGGDFVVLHRFSTLSASVGHPRMVAKTQRNPPALFGAGLIDAIPADAIERLARAEGTEGPWSAVTGRVARDENGHLGRFGWKSHSSSLRDFVAAACAVELGLEVRGQPQGQPPPGPLLELSLHLDAAIEAASAERSGPDLSTRDVVSLTRFVETLPRPAEHPEMPGVEEGREWFGAVGCAECHTPDVGPVTGLYSDLLLHDMGGPRDAASSYRVRSSSPAIAQVDLLEGEAASMQAVAGDQEWRTPPLWGVRDSAPYMHDGSAPTLDAAIRRHSGEADASVKAYTALGHLQRLQLITFLASLTAPESV